jgi:hypothetical protein
MKKIMQGHATLRGYRLKHRGGGGGHEWHSIQGMIETAHSRNANNNMFANITCRLRCGKNHIVRTIASDTHALRTADR